MSDPVPAPPVQPPVHASSASPKRETLRAWALPILFVLAWIVLNRWILGNSPFPT